MKSMIIVLMVIMIEQVFPQVLADRSSLLRGEAGNLAAVAEMHGYPDPKQVLELAPTLKLSDMQKKQMSDIYAEMSTRAKELGKQIVKIEDELKSAFQAGLVNEKSVNDDSQQIGKLYGKLRGVYLRAHIRAKRILNESQIDLYKKLVEPAGKK